MNFVASLTIQTVLEGIHCTCIGHTVRYLIPVMYDSLTEEVLSQIQVASCSGQLVAVASCVVVAGVWCEELAAADFLFASNNFICLYQVTSQFRCSSVNVRPSLRNLSP